MNYPSNILRHMYNTYHYADPNFVRSCILDPDFRSGIGRRSRNSPKFYHNLNIHRCPLNPPRGWQVKCGVLSYFSMKVVTLPVGQMGTNCYLVEDSGEVGIIDPGDDGDFIIRRITDLGAAPLWIALTHGHFDHVLAATELALAYKIPVYLHPDDKFLLQDAKKSAEYFLRIEVDPVIVATEPLIEGTELAVGKAKLKVMGAPGHTPGGICLFNKESKTLFCGDSVFAGGGVGRTDFKYCSAKDLEKSILKILKLPDGTIVYPGHGEQTTISEFKKIRTKRISLKILR